MGRGGRRRAYWYRHFDERSRAKGRGVFGKRYKQLMSLAIETPFHGECGRRCPLWKRALWCTLTYSRMVYHRGSSGEYPVSFKSRATLMKYAVCARSQARRQDLADVLRDTADACVETHLACTFQLPFFLIQAPRNSAAGWVGNRVKDLSRWVNRWKNWNYGPLQILPLVIARSILVDQ